jgi:CRP/FNR family cyclic AMP-dependent transcriptional regulator
MPDRKLQGLPQLPEAHTAASISTHLHGVDLFQDIRDLENALDSLAALMSERRFAAGSEIIREGSSSTEMFILIEGRASVYKSTPTGDTYKVAIFEGKNNIAFGESGLIESDSRTATITADTNCLCLVLDRAAFERFSGNSPHWALPIYRRIAHAVMARLRKTNNDMLLLYNALVTEIRGS